ncbi:hypothetical protein AD998_01990 [bacterium 336/3]|nr:hypothetical protein AD998_01990 [bacterium 336/3]
MKLSQAIADKNLELNKIKAEAKQINEVKKEIQDSLDKLVIRYDFEGDIDLDEEYNNADKIEQPELFD